MAAACGFTHMIAACVAVLFSLANAGFSPSSGTNIAVYWGQNSYGQSSSQQRLSTYCSNTEIDVITVSFLTEIINPVVNFANAGDNCTVFPGTTLLSCPQIEEDIQLCQSSYQKTIMLSIGGATYTEGGFSSAAAAISAANNVWAMFGPEQAGSTVKRPFGKAVVDGFDFDFEAVTQNMQPFATQLRSLMDAATAAGGGSYYLSAAPQCPYPDLADDDMLNGGVIFDFIQVQFYNNYCGVSSFVIGANSQPSYNFDTWDRWARTGSANPNVKVLVGVPANTGAGAGYTRGNVLQAALSYSQGFSSFGGVMMWDMSQLYRNPGFQEEPSTNEHGNDEHGDYHPYGDIEPGNHVDDDNNVDNTVPHHVDGQSHNHSSWRWRACACARMGSVRRYRIHRAHDLRKPVLVCLPEQLVVSLSDGGPWGQPGIDHHGDGGGRQVQYH